MTAGGGGRSGSVTMHDVARAAGVSIKTVSNVINGYPYLRAETKARVEAAIGELGYQVNVAARNLRQGRTGMIALALPDQILCRDDCAGLCPECGKDLNAEPHEHVDERTDPRWAALESLREPD